MPQTITYIYIKNGEILFQALLKDNLGRKCSIAYKAKENKHLSVTLMPAEMNAEQLLCSHENFKTKPKPADSTKYTYSCQLVFLSGYHSIHPRVKLQPVPNSSPLKGHTGKYLSPRQKLLYATHAQ